MKLEGTRKLLGLVATLGTIGVLGYAGHLSDSILTAVGTAYAVFCGGNGVEHWSRRRGMPPLPKTRGTPVSWPEDTQTDDGRR